MKTGVSVSWRCGPRGTVVSVDGVSLLSPQADVETKLACGLASRALRQSLLTSRCWPQEVRLDMHDSRQLRWLQQHIPVRLQQTEIMETHYLLEGLV